VTLYAYREHDNVRCGRVGCGAILASVIDLGDASGRRAMLAFEEQWTETDHVWSMTAVARWRLAHGRRATDRRPHLHRVWASDGKAYLQAPPAGADAVPVERRWLCGVFPSAAICPNCQRRNALDARALGVSVDPASDGRPVANMP